MKPRLRWKFVPLLAVPLALYFYVAERNSWRPKTIKVNGRQSIGSGLVFSPSGRYLLIVGDEKTFLYDTESQTVVLSIKDGESPCFVDNNHFSIVAPFRRTNRTEVYSLLARKRIAVSPEGFYSIGALKSGEMLLENYTNQRKVFIWNYTSLKAPQDYLSLLPHASQESRRDIKMLADKETLYARDWIPYAQFGSRIKYVELQFWDVSKKKQRFKITDTPVTASALLTNLVSTTSGLCAWCRDGKIEVWNYKTGQRESSFSVRLPDLRGQDYTPANPPIALTPDGTMLAIGSEQGPDIGLWDPRSGQFLRLVKGKKYRILSLNFSPDGNTLVSSRANDSIQLWRVK